MKTEDVRMKKAGFLALFLLLLTMGAGYAECSHDYAMCHLKDVCADCGGAYTGNTFAHTWDEERHGSDSSHHWTPCKYCDEKTGVAAHFAACRNPDVCFACGADYDGNNIRHDWEEEYRFDESRHWIACRHCDAVSDEDAHRANQCTDGECFYCGAEGTFEAWSHTWAEERQFDETHCWEVCRECGETGSKEVHYVLCATNDTCEYCHVLYSGSRVIHDWDWETWYTNGNYHWYQCAVCGAAGEKEEHWADCLNPDVCAVCDVPYAGEQIVHEYYSGYPDGGDAYSHWYICENCGMKVDVEEHIVPCTNQTYCHLCRYDGCREGRVAHDLWGNQGKVIYDAEQHFYICSDCYEPYWDGDGGISGEHGAVCTDPHTCIGCSIYYDGDNLYHYYESETYYSDADYHWKLCLDCDARLNPEPHVPSLYAPEYCAVCDRLLEESMPGDANGDGMVDFSDIDAVLRYVSGWNSNIDTEAADVNDSGDVTVADVLLLMRYMADWEIRLK